jgi:2-C-methyl-D-erythritol 2,4-cyclodiphosphate synthase/2-C-methyl-D-erythritol 4-phosphate cytidylyltransferase
VVVAAGQGRRLGVAEKVMLPLAGRPMLAWPLLALEGTPSVGSVVVVAGPHTLAAVQQLVRDAGFAKVRAIVPGGERRQDSVAAGLAALPDEIAVVVIHDGARPLATPDLFDRCARAAAETGAAIAATPIADTLKRVADGVIRSTTDRADLWAAQTPQAFRLETLRRVLAAHAGETVTDEAQLCERAGVPVAVVPASLANLKVTHAADIAVADALLRAALTPIAPASGYPPVELREGGSSSAPRRVMLSASEASRLSGDPGVAEPGSFVPRDDTQAREDTRGTSRVGVGYDVHRFADGRKLVLGGVEIPHERGLAGHSDADVLLHAIADAILGAAALGDIGQHFPPSDERFRDADSQDLLRECVRLAREAGWAPSNIDATVIAEAPRLAPHMPAMRQRIATCLAIAPEAVGVKATTNEGMGAIGRGEGIAALAVVTLVPISTQIGV